MCWHSEAPRIPGWDGITAQERGSWKSVSLLSRCVFSACLGEETPANPSKPRICHLLGGKSVGSSSRCPGAWGQACRLAAAGITQSILRMSSGAAQGRVMLSLGPSRHGKALPLSEQVGAARRGPGSLTSVMDEHCDCSAAWAPSPAARLPEFMEILHTWSWPLPKATPASQRESLLTALCSARDAPEGSRSQDMASSTCLPSPGQGKNLLRSQRALFQGGCARRTPGVTSFRHEV